MADKKSSDKKRQNIFSKRRLNKLVATNQNLSDVTDQMLDKLQSDIYGAVPTKDVEALNSEFELLVNKEIQGMKNEHNEDTSTFIQRLYKDKIFQNHQYMDSIEAIFKANQNQAQALISETYRNKLIKRADIHEVASQLSELKEAVHVTRDAIIAADIVDGHICRDLKIDFTGEDDRANYISIIEKMEEHFDLHKKIKDFIIPYTLEHGEYYAYVIPHSKMFEDFDRLKSSGTLGLVANDIGHYESVNIDKAYKTVLECVSEEYKGEKDPSAKAVDMMYESVKDDFVISKSMKKPSEPFTEKTEIKKELKDILSRISVCNSPIPIPFMEEGDSVLEYAQYMTEDSKSKDKGLRITNAKRSDNPFSRLNNLVDDGVFNGNSSSDGSGPKSKEGTKFDDTKDCYFKLIDSMHLIPVKIMTKVIGYYYVQDEVLNIASDSNYWVTFEPETQHSVVEDIVDKIVKSFDKKFLETNKQFRGLIAEAIQFFNLHQRRLKFQYIPAEYIVRFAINEDENGDGTSILEPALFHAKLYLLLLLFKMMSIVSNSNDTKVHYIRNSGIDKDIANTIQAIARKMQSRQINITDLFSFTTLVNKVGNGTQLFIPVGRQNERGIETEVLAGQDVQLNNDLMDLLRNSYISETGVPAVILNNINEADFAKTLELGNTRFQQRVVSHQLSFNPSITELYRILMRYTTNIPDNIIECFHFVFQPPKNSAQQTTGEQVNNFDAIFQFAVSLFFAQQEVDDPEGGSTPVIREFKKLLAKDRLPFLNVDRLREIAEEARISAQEIELQPKDKHSEDDMYGGDTGGGDTTGGETPPPQ